MTTRIEINGDDKATAFGVIAGEVLDVTLVGPTDKAVGLRLVVAPDMTNPVGIRRDRAVHGWCPMSAGRRSRLRLRPGEHTDHCDRPGMLWQETILKLPVRGYCPTCGAVARRWVAPPMTDTPPARRRGGRPMFAEIAEHDQTWRARRLNDRHQLSTPTPARKAAA